MLVYPITIVQRQKYYHANLHQEPSVNNLCTARIFTACFSTYVIIIIIIPYQAQVQHWQAVNIVPSSTSNNIVPVLVGAVRHATFHVFFFVFFY